MRTADGETEVQLNTYEHFADREPLRRVVLERMFAGVSTRRHRRTQNRRRAGRDQGAVDVEVGGVQIVRGAPPVRRWASL